MKCKVANAKCRVFVSNLNLKFEISPPTLAAMAPRLLLTGLLLVLFCLNPLPSIAQSASTTLTNGNRLAYLDESDPFYPGLQFPKLTTPQWIGEEGVEAESFLRSMICGRRRSTRHSFGVSRISS